MKVKLATLTIDAMNGGRHGIRLMLNLLDRLSIESTIVFSGAMAQSEPDLVREAVDRGHEAAASTYHSNTRLSKVKPEDAYNEIRQGYEILSRFYDVKTFRAPSMDLPLRYLGMLEDLGIKYDISSVRPKLNFVRREPIITINSITRIPVTHEYPPDSKTLLGQHHVSPSPLKGARDNVRLIHFRIKKAPASDYEMRVLGKILLDYISRGYRFYRIDSVVEAWRSARQVANA